MKPWLIILMAGFSAAPALGQHEGHAMPESAPQPPPAAAPQAPAAAPAADPHAGHVMPEDESSAEEQDESMAGHDMSSMDGSGSAPPAAPPPAEAFSGPEHAADTLFDPAAMGSAREDLRAENGAFRSFWVMADRWETRVRGGEEEYLWDAQGWYGGDINKLWVKTEGEGSFGRSPEELEVQALWSRAVLPWWDFQAGVRHDFRPGPERTHLAVGVQGLAPYQFEVDAAAFLSDDGDLSARLEGEYELRITQRLILQPRLGLELEWQDVPERGIGSGLRSGELGLRLRYLGLRLRYELAREFAPYVGIEYERRFGGTADFARALGDDPGGWSFLIGLRSWF